MYCGQMIPQIPNERYAEKKSSTKPFLFDRSADSGYTRFQPVWKKKKRHVFVPLKVLHRNH